MTYEAIDFSDIIDGKASAIDFFKNNPVDFINYSDPNMQKLREELGLSFNWAESINRHTDFDHTNLTDLSLKLTSENLERLGMDIRDFYVLNKQGYRSDEFKKEHDGLHVMFAGCSNTFGDSMFKEYIWSYQVYERLSELAKVDGYYTTGVPGADIFEVMSQIIKYIRNVGMPDIVFVNLPDTERNPMFAKGGTYPDGTPTPKDLTSPNSFITSYINAVSMLIEEAGSEIYMFTYDGRGNFNIDHNDYRKYIDNYYTWTLEDHDMAIYEIEQKANKENHPLKDFMHFALDKSHPGIAWQTGWADFIWDKFINNTSKV